MEPISETTKLELIKLAAAEAHLENYRVHARWDIGKLSAEQIDAEDDGDKLAEATDWTAPRDVVISLAGGAA